MLDTLLRVYVKNIYNERFVVKFCQDSSQKPVRYISQNMHTKLC